jgi:hypothetical protein
MQIFLVGFLALALSAYATILWDHVCHVTAFVVACAIQEELIAHVEGIMVYLVARYEQDASFRGTLQQNRMMTLSGKDLPLGDARLKAIIEASSDEYIKIMVTVCHTNKQQYTRTVELRVQEKVLEP